MFIYKITNKNTNLSYIGQSLNPNKRFSNHLSDRYSPFFQEDKNNLILEILYEGDNIDEMEKFYIEKHNTLYPNGYNKQSGGKRDFKTCDETRKKISNGFNRSSEQMKLIRSKLVFTDEIRAKLAKSSSGRKHSEEAKEKMRKPKGDGFKEKCKIAQKKRLDDGYKPMVGDKIGTSKLKEVEVIEIIKLLKIDSSTTNIKSLAQKYNVTVTNIRFIHKNKSWKHLPR